ncbi:hypothetical protein M431DRAFT_506237 [Trichoderma harzianum CBS 226.95]|uniref:Uncharacterized protein n=1 Tax=Trichoderma harzianum CBS 226.95 TaxID=983964 RepID=A0A2T4AHC0_TRIHA|nr:hypothetical protein M431DRAFT_506237 [Trichoderma harzianum CBS 226.95]PTB56484.1 hypothetical protein M431DRAFT_506237 [Trichoderma harzianum CBS 226.95]
MYWTGACSMPVVLLLLLVSYAFRPTSCRKDPAKRKGKKKPKGMEKEKLKAIQI